MSVASEITRLQNAKSDIKTSIENKGVTVSSSAKLDEYSTLIDSIPSGGGDVSEYFDTEISSNTNSSNTILNQSLKKLPSITIASNVTSMSNAFNSYKGDDIPNLTFIDVLKITNTEYMFQNCTNLTTIPLFNTSNVTTMQAMFSYCTSLTTIPLFNTSNVTTMQGIFINCTNLTTIPLFNTSNVTNFSSMFYNCLSLTTIPQIDTSKGKNFSAMFVGTMGNHPMALTEIPELDLSSANYVSNMIYSYWSSGGDNPTNAVINVTTLGGFKNLGKAYLTSARANYGNYTFDISYCRNLTHDSLMNVINKLYDIATAGVQTQKLVLGSTNMAKLTAEEIAIATNKGWTVS